MRKHDDSHEFPLSEWLEAFRRAAVDLATASMRFDPRTPPGEDDGTRPGAYIAILSDKNSVHLALTASPAGIRTLARGLLGMRHDQPIGDREVVDAVSEIMNIVAGKVKSHMAGRDGQLRLGLPMFLPAPIQASAAMENAFEELLLGPVDSRLTVYRQAREDTKAA